MIRLSAVASEVDSIPETPAEAWDDCRLTEGIKQSDENWGRPCQNWQLVKCLRRAFRTIHLRPDPSCAHRRRRTGTIQFQL